MMTMKKKLIASLFSKMTSMEANPTPQSPPPQTHDAIIQEQPRSSVEHDSMSPTEEVDQDRVPTPPQETMEEKVETLTEGQLRTLFAGAPQFGVTKTDSRYIPTVSYPWNTDTAIKEATDTVPLAEPAFSAATLHEHLPKTRQLPQASRQYNGYQVDVVEMPSMLSAQGVEPGTIGFSHFLELPKSDILANELEQSQSSKDSFESVKNKETLQTTPERLGIRPVELSLIYDRLIEFQDMYEAFQDSPEPMTILNNQSAGDLYANLFTKFLTPPGYDDSTEDPTGLQTQIVALLRVLGLKGVWYDFSLVEWRIRLGQILWSEPEPVPEHEPQPLWTEREILLLQITLACELLLRLDAFTNADATDAQVRLRIDAKDVEGFLNIKTRKVDWDLVLARRFLDNIVIMRGSDAPVSPKPKLRGLLSLLGQGAYAEIPQSDLVILPQNQSQQLSGLLHFAKTLQWPNIDVVSTDLARKLGVQDKTEEDMPSSPSGRLVDTSTPSGISIYGTPLQTPLPSGHQLDSYFGHVGKPVLNRNNSRALRMPLSPVSTMPENHANSSFSIGGWLSRSYLTGLVLPGEAISHFLISTLLENDSIAIANLGESANLYGGFTFGNRTFWSKTSVVGRILACIKGSAECMGWVSCPKVPDSPGERWYSIHSEVLSYENRSRVRDGFDIVTEESAAVPIDFLASVKSEDLVLPQDLGPSPNYSPFAFSHWELVPINTDLIDGDSLTGPPTESDVHAPLMTFVSGEVSHNITLTYDVQFVTSFPCTTAASAPPSITYRPKILRRSVTGTLSRSSSKHSVTLSRRNSHGFEPLLSHPPDAAGIAPKRMYEPPTGPEVEMFATSGKPMYAHPLHKSYTHKIVPVTDILDPDFLLPFELHTSKSTERLLDLSRSNDSETEEMIKNNKKAVLVLDTRASSDLQLLARAWCAEKGLHAIVSRVGRTCLGCSIREARGLGINIVIRV